MLKLITQIGVAIGIWYGSQLLGLHYLASIVLIFAGFAGIHLLWEKFFFNPYDYLGVMHVDAKDPLMMKAEETAKSSLGYFLSDLYPKHKDDSMVKFSYQNAEGDIEKLWGDLVSVTNSNANVYVRTPPIVPKKDFDRHMDIELDDIVDWSIELHDGSLWGGFSNQALFKIFEREEGYMHPKFQEHIARYKEVNV